MRKARVIALSIALLLCGIAVASVSQRFQHYTTADGLPSNCIRDILQDEDGFIWLASDGGLTRFDGLAFKTFGPEDAKIDPFVSTVVLRDHALWIATVDGLRVYDAEHEKLIVPKLNYPDRCSEIKGFIRHMAVDAGGTLWIAMDSGTVFSVSPSGSVKCYDISAGRGSVNTVFVDKRGDVWATGSYTNCGLYRYDAQADRFKRFEVMIDGAPIDIRTMAIAEDDRNRLWIGQWDGSLVCLNPFTGVARKAAAANPASMLHIHSVTPVGKSSLYIGSDIGVAVYDTESGECTLLTHDELQPASLSGAFVYPIKSDAEGGLWIGTFYAGLNYLAPDIKHFDSSRHSRFVNSVSGNIISSFCQDGQGCIYIGSEDGGVCRYDRATDTYTALQAGGGTDNVHTLCIDGDRLWVGTYSNGIRIYDTRTGRLLRDMSQVKTTAGATLLSCYTMYLDRQGDLWIASANEIMRYNPAADRYELVRNLGAWTTDIKEDEGGNLWFSTQGQGLYRYSRANGQWRRYAYESGVDGSLPYNHVSCIDFDASGQMWVATGNGLAIYRAATDDFAEVPVEGANRTMSFVKASGTDLWIGTSNGLVRFTPETGESAHFTVVDGLADNQFCMNSVYQDANGLIYVGTTNGYTRFDPKSIGRNTVVPPIVFTSLDIAGRRVEVGSERLPVSLNGIKCLKLGPDDNGFSIAFAALSYANPDNNSYLYMLEGFDKDWMAPDRINRASYTNLPPGHYTLRVKASNNDKVWNEAGISLPITISPHWYNSWPARVAYVILCACLVLSLSYIVVRYNRRQHTEELERVKSAKEREVYQAKLNFFTTVAHEIRTPVSLILGPLESIMKSREQFTDSENEDLDIIHRNTKRLLFLINQLLDFKKVESLAMDAQFKACDISALIKSVTDRFSPSLAHRGVKLEVNLPREAFSADVDAEALTKLVSNLLNNARKYTRSLVAVTCSVDKARQTFTIEVADDGIGISESDISRIFKPFVRVGDENREGGTGLGLSIVKRVVKAHSGHIEVKSQLEKGACFIVELPLHQACGARPSDIVDASAAEPDVEPIDDAQTADEPQDNGRPVMLVVDDNTDLLRFLSNYFSSGYTVITATDATEALKRLAEGHVDLIISDWMMPGMSGVEFCRRVRENRDISHIPFILLTARTDEGSKIEGMNCRADAYIEKPFSIDYLAARITNLLEIRRLLKQKFSTVPLEPIETLAANPVDNEFLSQLTKLIEDNFSNPELSVDFLCQGLGISRSGLYAKVRMLTDTTPNELIQLTRLKRAAQLLSEHRYRINEICYMVGFSNPSYFAKCFQRQFGMKPGEFTA